MEDDQQFCLRWNNHQSTLIQNFDTLLESGTLVDCTLAAEGKTLKAHKVVLSACSPYFECLLSEHYDKHPVFILKDVKFKELKAMMDYMYRGEVNISQDQLAALLKAAESLQIKGLSESKTAGSSKTESRPQKTVSQPTAPSLDIPHASSGLTIEKNKVPRQSLAQSCVGDLPEDTASPQVSKGHSSREGSQSPTSRKRKRIRRRSLTEDNTIDNQDASNSSDMPQQSMGVPALGIAPVADEKVHADPTDSLGRSALMTQLTKPADEMLQLPLEKPEPNDNLIEPKSEYLDDTEEGVEDLTLDDDMNDLNDMEQDNNRAGPSHDSAQHPAAGLGSWHVTGDRSNAGGVVGSVAGAPGTGDEVFLAAQEAAHRDSQEKESSQEVVTLSVKKKRSRREENTLRQKDKSPEKRKSSEDFIDFIKDEPTTSTPPNSANIDEEEEESLKRREKSPEERRNRSNRSSEDLTIEFIKIEPTTSTARNSANIDEEESLKRREKSPEERSNRSNRSSEDLIIDFIKDEPTMSPARNSANIDEEEKSLNRREKSPELRRNRSNRSSEDFIIDFIKDEPTTSTARNSANINTEGKSLKRKEKSPEEIGNRPKRRLYREDSDFINVEPSTSTARFLADVDEEPSKHPEIISLNDSQTDNDNENIASDDESSSPWTDSKDVAKLKKKHKCPHCDMFFEQRHHLIHHIMTTCLLNPDSKTNKTAGKFKCVECGRNYTHLKGLRYHQRHECNRTVQCPDCGVTMKGSVVTLRHKREHCVKKQHTTTRKTENIKQDDSLDELFIDDSSIDFSCID